MKKLLAVVISLSAPAFAAGFRIDTQAGRATGMGSAVSAFIDDSSANFYNPAGLTTRGKGFEVMAGDTLIIPQLKFTGEDGNTTSSSFQVSPPPHLYARAGLFDELAVGIGFFVPYGASGNWPPDWVGQYRAKHSSLQTYNLNVNLAYQPHRRISFAAGVSVIRGTVFIERNLNFVDNVEDTPGTVELGGSAWGVGFNGGVRLEAIEDLLYVGGSIRSSSNLIFTGRSHFSNIPTEFQSRIYDQPIRAGVTLPVTGQFGLGFKLFKKLRAAIDVTYVGWSSFRELRIEFQDNPDLTVPLPKRWFDTASLHLGLEYDVTQSIQARVGFVYDPTPSPSDTLTPDLPDASRIKVSAGIGYTHPSGLFADLGFQFVALLSQRSTAPGFPGTYSGTAQVISLSIGFRRSSADRPAEPAPEAPPADAPAATDAPPAATDAPPAQPEAAPQP